MFTSDPRDALLVANQCARRLREASAAERLFRDSSARRALAAFMRRVADRLDPASFAPRPA